MLKVLAELEKLAEALDSKKQYKFADEIEGIMTSIVSKAGMKKKAAKLPRDQWPDPIRELGADVGDPYSYGYLAHNDSFVIVDGPSGLGTVIDKSGPYSRAWELLQGRLPDDLRLLPDEPSASGPVQEDPKVDYSKRNLPKYVKAFLELARQGQWGNDLARVVTSANLTKRLLSNPDSVLPTEARSLRGYIDGELANPKFGGALKNTDGTATLRIDGQAVPGITWNYNSILAKIEDMAETIIAARPHNAVANEKPSEIQKEASFDLATAMEVAFHAPSSTPFGR